jgi:hypothetical protein
LLKHKVAQKVTINLGYFIFSKNLNELPKVAQLAKNRPIWSPCLQSSVSFEQKYYRLLVEPEPREIIHLGEAGAELASMLFNFFSPRHRLAAQNEL